MLKVKSTKSDLHHVKMLCYGESGVGKTVLSSTAPEPLIISAERGLLSLRHLDIPTIEVSTLEDIREAHAYAMSCKQETICLDSLSELAEMLLIQFKGETKDPRQAYGRMADEMATVVRKFRSINKHVYMIAKQSRLTDEVTGKVSYQPLIPGQSFATNVPYLFDIVACLRIGKREKEEYRYLQTQPSIQYVAKDRSGLLDKEEAPDLTKLFTKIVGK